jgi:hypothetical protein
MLTNEQKEFYKKLVNEGKSNRLQSLRLDLIKDCKMVSSTYFEDKRKDQYKRIYWENIEEIQFINSLLGISEEW